VKLVVGADPGEAAVSAVDVVVRHAWHAIAGRGRFVLALSGGRTPGPFLDHLARCDLEWSAVSVLQVDERLVPDDDADRNAGLLAEHLGPVLDRLGAFVPVPVDADDPAGTASAYRRLLCEAAGDPPVLDVVHLGLGADGHTASLVPGDGALDVVDAPVAVSGPYQGHRRLTLTRPVLDGSRHRLWFVLGGGKERALAALLRHDPTVPAGRIRSDATTVVVDRAALGLAPAV
jgi:6-phosphogluconolactonase